MARPGLKRVAVHVAAALMGVGVGWGFGWGGAFAAGQEHPSAPVFTAEQATAGKSAYAKSCASCHMPDLSGSNEMPALSGAAFIETWGARSTKELFDYVAAAMPYGGPSLTPETYADVVAFMLHMNGARPGPDTLNATTEVRIASLMRAR